MLSAYSRNDTQCFIPKLCAMINTLFCDSRIEPASYITICVVAKEHLFSRNSEAEASEIKNNVEKLLLYSGS